MKNAYIIRIRFNSDMEVSGRLNVDALSEEWIKYRLMIFNRYTRKSIEAQTNQDFIAIVDVHKESMKLVNRLIKTYEKLPKNIIFTERGEDVIADYIKDKDYVFISQLDSDDMYHPSFIEYLHNYKPNPNIALLLVNNGYIYNQDTHRIAPYHSASSPFFTRIFKVREYLSTIRYYKYIRHFFMQYFPHDVCEQRLCLAILHGKNSYTRYSHYYPALFEDKMPLSKEEKQEMDKILAKFKVRI